KIVLDSANNVLKIECEGDIEIKAQGNVIFSGQSMKFGASGGISASASSQLLTHANSGIGFKASSDVTVSGAQITMNTSSSPATQGEQGDSTGEVSGGTDDEAKEQEQETSGDDTSSSDASGGGPAVSFTDVTTDIKKVVTDVGQIITEI